MAGLYPSAVGQEDTSRPRFERAGPDLQREALALLLTGRPSGRDPAVDRFLRSDWGRQILLDELWIARDDRSRPAMAALLTPCPGRTAMLFASPASSWPTTDLAAGLLHAVCAAQDPAQTRLIQALLDPGQSLLAAALERAGFTRLAELIYMQRQAHAPRKPQPLILPGENYRLLHWSEEHRQAFRQVILASYEQTRDCPGLLGLRQIDDVIAGHMAAGRFDPNLWFALYEDQHPVGVMLLSPVITSSALELVYLGLSLPYRGRGLGKRLLNHALALAAQHGYASVILAVDKDNTPAVRLYQSAGFQTVGRKIAMIRVLPAS